MVAFGFVFGPDGEQPQARPLDSFDLRPSVTPLPTEAGETAEATETATATPTPDDGGVVRMMIPSIGADYPIEDIGLVEGANQLDTPHDEVGAIGWYDIWLEDGRKPGLGQNSVFSAHVNYEGREGPFARLSEVQALDEVVVVMENGAEYHYQVFAKKGFVSDPAYATADRPAIEMGKLIEAQDKPPGEEWVTLITCSCGPGRVVNIRPDGYGDCVDRDVVIARRML